MFFNLMKPKYSKRVHRLHGLKYVKWAGQMGHSGAASGGKARDGENRVSYFSSSSGSSSSHALTQTHQELSQVCKQALLFLEVYFTFHQVSRCPTMHLTLADGSSGWLKVQTSKYWCPVSQHLVLNSLLAFRWRGWYVYILIGGVTNVSMTSCYCWNNHWCMQMCMCMLDYVKRCTDTECMHACVFSSWVVQAAALPETYLNS